MNLVNKSTIELWNRENMLFSIYTLYNVCSVHRGCSVLRGVFSTSGDTMSTSGGYHEYIRGIS